MKKYFNVRISGSEHIGDFNVVRPASLNNPKNNSVMFVTTSNIQNIESLSNFKNCLIYWPENEPIPDEIILKHVVKKCKNPRNSYCDFFKKNKITNVPKEEKYELINGAYVAKDAIIGKNCIIFPGAYIGGEVVISDNCYIGSGVKLIGNIYLGNNVVIRENSVIGADGLSTNRDEDGKALTMPQFGGVIIEENVQIGALTVISRGAIDNTIIKKGSKIDNCSFISHNVVIGEDTFIVGETIMFGSSSSGKGVLISGNSTIRNGVNIGEGAKIGMGSVVVNDIKEKEVVKGNPAR